MENKYEKIEEKLIKYNINGLDVYIIPKPSYLKKTASLCVKFGSKDLSFSVNDKEFKTYPEGIAHFLEHKVFESDEGNSFEKFSNLGARVNAFTNANITNYYFSTLTNFNSCLKELFSMVMNPFFTEENVEKEKGIIEQEIKMYEDEPFTKLYYGCLKGMYSQIPIYKDIAGSVESIYKITPELLKENFDAFYRIENMNLVIVGDIDIDEITELVKELVLQNKSNIKVERKKYNEKNSIVYDSKSIKLDIKMNRFLISFKDTILKTSEDMIKRDVIMDFIGYKYFSPSTKLYQLLYQSGLINENFQASYNLYSDYCFQMIYGESVDIDKTKEIIMSELMSKENAAVTKEEFVKIKKILIGKFFESFNSIDGLGYILGNYFSKNMNFFDYYEAILDLSEEDIQENIIRLFKKENAVFVRSN